MRNSNQRIVFSFTENGTRLSRILCEEMSKDGYECIRYAPSKYVDSKENGHFSKKLVSGKELSLPEDRDQFLRGVWGKSPLIFIGAAGIAVRFIAPYVRDKFTDSPVVVVDEKGNYVIPLLSGHVGGAVELAEQVAGKLGGVVVNTTATDVQKKFAVDVFARKNALHIMDRETAKLISSAVLNGEKIGIYSLKSGKLPAVHRCETQFPEDVCACDTVEQLKEYRWKVVIGESVPEKLETDGEKEDAGLLLLKPVNVVAGLGCRKGISYEDLEQGVVRTLAEQGVSMDQICAFASIDLKKDEPAILELSHRFQIPFVTYSAEQMREIKEVTSRSEFVEKTTGVDNVCERAALAYCKSRNCEAELILGKQKKLNMTIALALIK